MPLLHDDDGRRVLDVGGPGGPRWSEHCARHEAEEAGEDLRLLYVALTRARCQVVTWWVPRDEHRPRRRCTGCCSGGAAGRDRRPRRRPVPNDAGAR